MFKRQKLIGIDWFKKGRLFDFSSAKTLQDMGFIAGTDVVYHGSDAPPEKIKKEGLKTTPNYMRLPGEEMGQHRNVVFITPRKDIAQKYGKFVYEIYITKIRNYKVINDEVDYDSVGVLSNIPSNAISFLSLFFTILNTMLNFMSF